MLLIFLVATLGCGGEPTLDSLPPASAELRARMPPCDPDDSPLVPVSETDSCNEILSDEMARIEQRPGRSRVIELVFRAPREIQGKAIGELFPNYRFFLLSWDQKMGKARPPGSRRISGLAVGIGTAIAVNKWGTVARLGSPDCEAFGDFLAINGVRILDANDARLVRDAFCEVERMKKTGKLEKVSTNVWRLGVTRSMWGDRGLGRYCFEVELNPDSSVKAGRMKSLKPDGTVGSD